MRKHIKDKAILVDFLSFTVQSYGANFQTT